MRPQPSSPRSSPATPIPSPAGQRLGCRTRSDLFDEVSAEPCPERPGRRVQLTMGVATAAMSIVIGGLFLLGIDGVLPAFFAG